MKIFKKSIKTLEKHLISNHDSKSKRVALTHAIIVNLVIFLASFVTIRSVGGLANEILNLFGYPETIKISSGGAALMGFFFFIGRIIILYFVTRWFQSKGLFVNICKKCGIGHN